MSSIHQDFAYRKSLSIHLAEKGSPPELGLQMSVRDGVAREVSHRVRILGGAGRLPDFFRLGNSQDDLQRLYLLTKEDQRSTLLKGLADYLLDEATTADQANEMLPLVSLLLEEPFEIGEQRKVLLQGHLYFALKKVMSPSDALSTYQMFADFDEPFYHTAIYNSFFDRVISRALNGNGNHESVDDLAMIEKCRHLSFFDNRNEAERWLGQIKSLSNLASRGEQSVASLALEIGHARISHLGDWLSKASSVEAMQPFMPAKTLTSKKAAAETFRAYVTVMGAMVRLHKLKPLSSEVPTSLSLHALKLLKRFFPDLMDADWSSLDKTNDLPVDWALIFKKMPLKGQIAILEKLPSHNLMQHAVETARQHKFIGDLGL